MGGSLLRLSIRRSARCGYQSKRLGRLGVERLHSTTPHLREETRTSLPLSVRIRDILHTSSQLFVPGSPLASSEWLRRTETAASRLAGTLQRRGAGEQPMRVAVVGEARDGTQELMNVLLDDPMLEYGREGSDLDRDVDFVKALQNYRDRTASLVRHKPFYILYGEESRVDDHIITIPAQWLRDENVELMEIVDPAEGHEAADLLYSCDQIFFVLDELTLAAYARFGEDLKKSKTLRLLQHFVGKPGSHVVVNHQSGPSINEIQVEKGLQAAISERAYEQLVARRVDDAQQAAPLTRTSFDLARRANDALRSALHDAGPTSTPASAWEHFSTLFAASGLAEIRRTVESRANGSPAAQNNNSLAASIFTAYRSLDQANLLLNRDVEHARRAFEAADALLAEVRSEREEAIKNVFSQSNDPHSRAEKLHKRTGDRSKSVEAANIDAWNVVENTFARRLPWWKIIWKVDDVRAETEAAIARGFAKQLEQNLILQTGRLYSVAERLHRNIRSLFTGLDERKGTTDLTASRKPSSRDPFDSPVLLNELRKYPLEKIEAELKSDVLLRPIKERRDELVAVGGPLDVLCRRAQKNALMTVSTVGVTGLTTLSAAMAGSTTFGPQFPAALQHFALQPSTAAATFALVTLASLWLTQTRWTRAKKRFWRDWERLSDGMDVDLQNNVRSTFDHIIAGQSLVAAQSLRDKAKRYIEEIGTAQSAVDAMLLSLRQEANAIIVGSKKE